MLRDADAEVWLLDVDILRPVRTACAACLSDDERVRRDRFVQPQDRTRYELFRGALRLVLGGCLRVAPAALTFSYGPAGRPSLAPPQDATGLDFNLSHAGDVLAVAVRRNGRVGVDVESLDRRLDAEGLAARFFHPREQARLARTDAALRPLQFLQGWTAREAWVKARGEGMAEALAAMDFSAWTDEAAMEAQSEDARTALLMRLPLPPGLVGVLVADPAVERVTLRVARSLPATPA